MKTAFIDCSNIRSAKTAYRTWRKIGYSRKTARRLVLAEFERDPEIAALALFWVDRNTNQGRAVRFGRG
jgi:hypothetical protein